MGSQQCGLGVGKGAPSDSEASKGGAVPGVNFDGIFRNPIERGGLRGGLQWDFCLVAFPCEFERGKERGRRGRGEEKKGREKKGGEEKKFGVNFADQPPKLPLTQQIGVQKHRSSKRKGVQTREKEKEKETLNPQNESGTTG